MIWVEVNPKYQKREGHNTTTGWKKIIQLKTNEFILKDDVHNDIYYDSFGKYMGNPKYAQVYFQPPEIKDRPAAPEKTYTLGDCFRGPGNAIYKIQSVGSSPNTIIWANCINGTRGEDPFTVDNHAIIRASELQDSHLFTYLGPFNEIFSRKEK